MIGSTVKAIGARRHNLFQGICVTALASAIAMPASAQDAAVQTAASEEAAAEDVVITGARRNLESAQNRKRNADTVVDSITAEDIGSFPDKSVAEALQRVPGITVNRFSGTDDTSHFSAEPSGVIIRGLNQVRSEFNGRDTFSANSSRGLSWQDISPELLGGIDTYKNQTADLIEGGIAGTVNLRTRLPFDSKGRLISLSIKNTYGDIAKKSSPEVSGIISDRWETGIGEIGLMVNGAYAHAITASQGVQFGRMGVFRNAFGELKPTDPAGTQYLKYIPSGIYLRENEYDRKRYGVSAAFQWKSNDESMLLTGQYNRSQYNNSWREYSVFSNVLDLFGRPSDSTIGPPPTPDDLAEVFPLDGTSFKFDDDGDFLSGWWSPPRAYLGDPTATIPDNAYLGLGLNSAGQPFYNRCYGWTGCAGATLRRAPSVDTQSNALRNKQVTQDFGLNFRWDVTDRLRVTVDGQYVDASVGNYNASVTTRSYADTFVDLTGKYPRLEFKPTVATNINLSPGGLVNPNNYHYYAITDHTEDSDGQEFAFRMDAEYDVDSGWLDAIKVGARYADRDQTVRWGAYNWANISNTWTNTQASYFNLDKPVYPTGNYATHSFSSDFFAGNQLTHNSFVFFNMDKLANREDLAKALGRPAIGVGDYFPVCSNAGYRAGETVKDKFGCYLPSEIHKVSERTVAAYAMAKFGGDGLTIGGVRVSGNVGVRLVWTNNATQGAATFANPFTAADRICTPGTDGDTGRPTATAGCVIGASEIAFNNGATVAGTTDVNHFHALPSFNIKFDLTDKLVSRFAYSRAMSRPDFGLLRNFLTVSRVSPNVNDFNNTRVTRDADGRPIAYDWDYTGQMGNPRLKPITADQFDLTFEYYMSSAGSLTLTGFYKKFYDYIQQGSFDLSVTNNGVTEPIRVTGPVNGEGAAIYGAEAAFQTFFDFLPAPFDGLGVQANYTYVKNDGIETVALTNETAGGIAGGGLQYSTTAVKAKALEGVSEHAFNIVGMYEKGKLSARLAYNWRSKFLVTAIDCCVALPVWQEAAGYMDASIRFRATSNIEFIVEGTNLLGTDTVLKQQVNNDGLLKDNAWFKNDRRFQIGARLTF
ncbi:TonB-dependent receptor [Sphingomonas koreensis]|uniref:TonB-dependent receptor n=1 Tax=Sphingomonas koreensis TaxID=93064 RepID=UPI00082A04D0|nr:TonB-dependent receptor [Sphingomonas koreensis]PJI88369.1 TonB-dependent receptor [Sphingomonas koreensis]RSU58703.1 TonB-dependent receptor [Sphingomonas koreensis]RSU66869.1 TonB-dependent receptor [Sphingomonas koreensis]